MELEDTAPVATFPALAPAFPSPTAITIGGWGFADADPFGGVALEVTIAVPQGPNLFTPVPPTLRSWPASLMSGGGICHADSGDPIFAGRPTTNGASGLKLIGIVAGGTGCGDGKQVMTDLTNPATVRYMCKLAASNPYCVTTQVAAVRDRGNQAFSFAPRKSAI